MKLNPMHNSSCAAAGLGRVSLLGLALLVASASAASAAGGFSGFEGRWRGGGQIILDSGPEEIRCRATYAVRPDGDALNVNMTCASDSYRVHIKTFFVPDQDGFSGSWQETTRQVQGSVSGRFIGPGRISADLEALGVQLEFTASVAGNRQTLTLRSQGSAFVGADIVLRK